jgi:DNA-binding FrmR family transcriptional regulator
MALEIPLNAENDERELPKTADRRATRLRLARIEGQVRGISRMLEEEREPIDLLNQLAAVQQALRQITRELLADHLRATVDAACEAGDPEERERMTEGVAGLMFKYSR